MRVLVTGGAGFIGSHLVDALIDDHDVAVIDDLSTGDPNHLPADAKLFDVDVRDGAAVRNVIGKFSPDVVFHEAAQISVSLSVRDPVLDAEINACGLLNVLSAAAEQKTSRVIFASSGGVLYGETTFPAGEDQSLNPVSPYGITKWVGERYLKFFSQSRGLTCVALRYSNVYGPRQNPHGEAGVVAIFAQKLLDGEAPIIHGDGGCVRDYIYVSDVVAANAAAMRAPLTGFSAFNIGTGIGTDVNALAARVRDACAAALSKHNGNALLPQFENGPARAGDLRCSLISPERAAAALNWRPTVLFDDGIEKTVQWFVDRDLTLAAENREVA